MWFWTWEDSKTAPALNNKGETDLFEWLKKLFRKKDQSITFPAEALDNEKRQSEHLSFMTKEARKQTQPIFHQTTPSQKQLLRQLHIAEQNQERQKSTMSYGLKTRNFRPRPAYEKRLYNLQKKPED